MKLIQLENKVRNKAISLLQALLRSNMLNKRLKELLDFEQSGSSLSNSCSFAPVVSLTSYGKRLKTVYLSILSIMDQTIPPRKVVLYLDDTIARQSLPPELTALESRGLEIRQGVDDLRGHKKYFYAASEYPNSPVVTIDDDLIYPRNTIKHLVRASKKNPGAVVARRVHRVILNDADMLEPYSKWLYEYRGIKRFTNSNFLTSGAGTLFPSGSLKGDILNSEALKSCALMADDVWLNCGLRAMGIKVVRARIGLFSYWEIEGTQAEALKTVNVAQGGNDLAMRLSMKYFSLTPSCFVD